jgi:hypothetical protein
MPHDGLRYIRRIDNLNQLEESTMGKLASQILVTGLFLASMMVSVTVAAQTSPAHPATTANTQQAQHKAMQNTAENNPACQRIVNECKKLGFIVGEWKQDNGLWKDCFDPVVKGKGNATRDGKPISVPVSQSDVQTCRTAVEQHHKTAQ